MAFTQREINALNENGVYTVDEDLYLRVRGQYKNYFVKIQQDGKRKEKGIGSANKITLAGAKARAIALRKNAQEDAAWNVDKHTENESTLFRDIYKPAIESIRNTRRWKSDKHAHQWLQTIEQYALPDLGGLDVATISKTDIYTVLDEIWETKTETATRLRSRLEKIFDYCIFNGYRTDGNPALWRGNLELILPPVAKIQTVEHHAAMTLREAQTVATAFSMSPYVSHQAVLFGMLTAARVSEFLYIEWDEINVREKLWLCPVERSKTGIEYRFPLSPAALSILAKRDRNDRYVFTGARGGAMCVDTCRKTLRTALKRAVTMHGCRSTFRDWCAESGVDPIVAEKCLMHQTGNEVEQAYQRSDLLDKRRKIMEQWAEVLLNT